MPLPFLRQEHLAALERIRENLPILSVHQDDALRVASLDETNEVVVARVRAEVELLPLAFDIDRDAVQVNHAFVDEPPAWLSTDTAVYIGIVYSYLPFMVLPIYATLEKMDQTLLEAATDLGCPNWKAFWLVTLPLSRPGVVAGILLCFIPIIGEFVVPDLLGSSQTMMIGQTLWGEFFANKDWPVASAVAVVLLCLLVVPIVIYEQMQTRDLAGGR